MNRFIIVIFTILLLAPISAKRSAAQNQEITGKKSYPAIVLYSTTWCPYCKRAMDYFKRHNIPFTNKDIEKDDVASIDLSVKYKAQGVPLIVIGKDEKIIRGFDEKTLDRILMIK